MLLCWHVWPSLCLHITANINQGECMQRYQKVLNMCVLCVGAGGLENVFEYGQH